MSLRRMVNDLMKRPEQILGQLLKSGHLTIALAESISCGLAAYKLGSIPGASDFLCGSVVCYDEKVKTELLRVKMALINKHSSESQQVTDALNAGLQKLIAADIYASVTGLATSSKPEIHPKPLGTVYFSVLYKRKYYRISKRFKGSPREIKSQCCGQLFLYIAKIIRHNMNG